MFEKRFDTGTSPILTIRCKGDLRVRGWAEPTVLVNGDETEIDHQIDALIIEAQGELNLMVPALATINIESVGGDLAIKNIEGVLELATASGDVSLRNIGEVSGMVVHGDLDGRNIDGAFSATEIMGDVNLHSVHSVNLEKVHGDLSAIYLESDVHIDHVMGDALLETIAGDIRIHSVRRDVNLRNLGGIIKITNTYGDIRLIGGLAAGKHHFVAGGDIVVRWPSDAPAVFEARSPSIRNRLVLKDVVVEEEFLSGRRGDGETFLVLEAGGRIILKDAVAVTEPWGKSPRDDFDWIGELNGLGEQIASEIGNRMIDWSSHLEREFGPEFSANIEKKTQVAAVRAEQAAEKAVRQAEKAAKKVRRQAERQSWNAPASSRNPDHTQSNVTEEEQLKILRMVEQGIISPEEANALLEAIGS